jgi:hypothetical protein
MRLLKLNLLKPLEWSRTDAEEAGIHGVPELAAAIANAPEGAEGAITWDWHSLMYEQGDDGPRSRRPLPAPDSAATSGLRFRTDSIQDIAIDGNAGNPEAMRMEAGRYLFVQTRAPVMPEGTQTLEEWLADSMEWFAREAWWTKSACAGPLLVRFVREDGNTAVQILRRLA